MESTPRIMLIDEVADAYRAKVPTVRLWEKLGQIPAKISMKHGKCRWLASDIEAHILSLAKSVPPPVNAVGPRVQRREQKTFAERQRKAAEGLAARHDIAVDDKTT